MNKIEAREMYRKHTKSAAKVKGKDHTIVTTFSRPHEGSTRGYILHLQTSNATP
jgi:hypothetical protein